MEGNLFFFNPKILLSRQTSLEMSGSKIKRLRKQIKENGFDINKPIKVVEIENQLIILDGHHRVEVAKKLRLTEIPIIKETVSDYQREKLLMDIADAQKYNRDY